MDATLADVTTARDWLLSEGIFTSYILNENLNVPCIGAGLSHHGINIEYCMVFHCGNYNSHS